MKNLKFMISIFVLTFFYMYVANITQIPKDIVLLDKEKLDIKLLPYIEKIETVKSE